MYIKVKKLSKDFKGDICYIPSKLYSLLNLNSIKKYVLNLGMISKEVYLHPNDNKNNNMYFPRHILKALMLFSDIKLTLWKTDNKVYLGPVIGVFVNSNYLSSIKKGKIPESCERLFQANEKGRCLIYYFSLDKINWIDKKIKGIVFSPKQNDFRYYWLPIPNVIYDRGVSFKKHEKKLVKHIRKQFDYSKDIHFINNKDYLSKWHLYKKLFKHQEMRKYLPETIRYSSFNDLIDMLNKYDFVFLKSYYGSRGREVMSLCKIAKGYKIVFYDNELQSEEIYDLDSLKSQIEKFIGDNKYIIQQGINLSEYKGRKYDLRILIEKDINGKWIAIYNQGRIAKDNLTITNSSTGGDILNYFDIYSLKTIENIPTDGEIREQTIKIATYIEREYGSFGELGMDMAIDKEGRVWFLEANTKPDKNPEEGLEDMEGISPQFLSILEYSKFLAKGEK